MLFLSWRLFCSCFSIQIWRNIFNFFSLFSGRRLHLVDVSGSAGSHPSRHSHVPNRSQPGTHSKYLLALSLFISFIYKSRYLPSLNKNQWLKLGFKVWSLPVVICPYICFQYLPHLKQYKSVTDKVYLEISKHFQNLYGDYAGWAHSVKYGNILFAQFTLIVWKEDTIYIWMFFLISNSHTASEVKLPWLVNWTCM